MLSCVLQIRDELPHGFFLALECSSTPQKACRASSVKETVVVLTNHFALLLIQWSLTTTGHWDFKKPRQIK